MRLSEAVRQPAASTEGNKSYRLSDVMALAPENIKKNERNFFGNMKESFIRGQASAELDQAAYLARNKMLDFDTEVRPLLEAQKKIVSGDPIEGENFVSNTMYAIANMAPAMLNGIVEGKASAAIAGGAAAVSFPPAVIPMAIAGDLAGSFSHWRRQGIGSIYAQNQMTEEPVAPEIATPLEEIGGSIYGAIEFSQIDKLIPGSAAATKRLFSDSLKRTIGRMALKYGKNWVTEVGEEGLQEIVQESALEVGKQIEGVSDKSIGKAVTDIALKGWEASKDSALPMLFLMAPGGVVEGARVAEFEKTKTQVREDTARQIVDIAKNMKEGEISIEGEPFKGEIPDITTDAEGKIIPIEVEGEKKDKETTIPGDVSSGKYLPSKGVDTIGRNIPDWDNAEVYHSTSEDAEGDIVKGGFRFLGEGQGGYYGTAISLSPDAEFTKQFGDKMITARVKPGANILNLNDSKDWAIWQPLIEGKSLGDYKDIALANGIDGVYDAGAGDLFIYNEKVIEVAQGSAAVPLETAEEVEWDEEITPEKIAPKKKGLSALDEKIQNIKDKAKSSALAKDALAYVKTLQKDLIRRVAPHKDGQLKEEYKSIPTKYKNKNGQTPDVIASNLGISESELSDYLRDLDSQVERLKEEIQESKPKVLDIRISEVKQLRDRMRDVMLGEVKGRQQTKEQIKAYQKELTDMIKGLDIPAKDKAKFLSTIKDANTAYMLNKKMTEVVDRADKYAEAEKKRKTKEKIAREIKYTKPVSGKGKYDYQSNKLFKEIRDIFRMSGKAAQEMLDSMEEDLSEIGLIKRRLVSFKANGASGSVALHEQVLADIKHLKYLGSLSKNEEAFLEKVGRRVAVEEVSDGIDKVKADKKTLKTKIGNMYRKGFTSIHSMISSIAGKEVADKLDPEINENAKDIAIFKKTKQITNKIAKILGLNKADDVIQEFQNRSEKVYEMVDRDGLVTQISKMQIMDIHNSIKNDLVRERYHNAFGEEQIDTLLSELTVEEEMIADVMMESIQEYKEVLNKRSIETTGLDMGSVENYWMATSEYVPDLTDDYKSQGETPSAMKARSTSSKVFPIPKNAWEKTNRHISQAEHVDKLSRQFVALKQVFSDRKVKNQIENKFGEDVYKTIMDQIENISLNRVTERGDFITGTMGKIVNNWVTAKISLNPSVFVKQLGSVINYAENMPSGQWAKGFSKGMLTPKETFKFMWEGSDGFLEARFNRGMSEAMAEALKGAKMIGKGKQSWTKGLSSWVRAGDISAIIYGGYPYVQHQIKLNKAKGMSDKAATKAAFKSFKVASLKSQQSGLSSGLSQFQNKRGAPYRLLLAFKNTANQYFRKQIDAIMQYQNGDISAKQLAKVTTIYSIINPMVFAGSGVLVKGALKGIGSMFGAYHDDDEDFVAEITSAMLMQMLINPYQVVPVLDDMTNFAARRAFGKPAWKVMSTPVLDDLSVAMQKLTKDDITFLDYMDSFGTIGEISTGLPIKTISRTAGYLIGD